MSERNKAVLREANAAIDRGDTEAFLSHCTEDLQWTAVGEMTLSGKDAVRRWMATAYATPPQYTVDELIAEGDTLVAIGEILAQDQDGRTVPHRYCDVWRVRSGKLAELRAFVIPASAT
ncbi:nuclear transport factor 2 family protein [Aquabacterium sp. J223]|uniref:nuclear transport factor 2 family protein n=1 Tax=Aquabacterium sp. J223 TaxID=2898431 RepID=UPI0021AD743C|nr:nuclear transport factor 2 family protein [Aquabacterium sp. J223]UUX94947.1 nuclear transport factor 2 family protein [Aquabacterium sp. J223]